MEGIVYLKAAAFIGAAFIMGIGTVGPAISQGLIGVEGCKTLAKAPNSMGDVRQIMIIALALVETIALYCVLIAGFLIYVGMTL